MNFELADKLYGLLESKKLAEAITLAEQELRNIPTTDFHKILQRNLLHLTSDLTNHIQTFDKSTKDVLKKNKVL
jgi:protein involved in temperature-dependent protein secretion